MSEQDMIDLAMKHGLRPNPILRDHHRWILPDSRIDGGDLHFDLEQFLKKFNLINGNLNPSTSWKQSSTI